MLSFSITIRLLYPFKNNLQLQQRKIKQSRWSESINYVGRVKWKSTFEPEQTAQIHIILSIPEVSPGPLLSIHTFCSIEWFSLRKTHLFIYIENFTSKAESFQIKNKYFSYFCSKHRLWYSLEPPRRGGSNEYPQSTFLAKYEKQCIPL